MTSAVENLILPGADGVLEVRCHLPSVPSDCGAIICHPHPLYGGTLENKVVHTLARGFIELGAYTLRFNFRGVGNSTGEFDQGIGESADLIVLAHWLKQRYSLRHLWLAGFSFGGYVALRSHVEIAPKGLILVAPALRYCHDKEECRVTNLPCLVVQGAYDTIVPTYSIESWLYDQVSIPDYHCLATEHFFHGHLNELRHIVTQWCRQLS
jgi:uncharacterized protein